METLVSYITKILFIAKPFIIIS